MIKSPKPPEYEYVGECKTCGKPIKFKTTGKELLDQKHDCFQCYTINNP